MRKVSIAITVVVLAAIVTTTSALALVKWTSEFTLNKSDLASTGRNPYFVLELD